MVAGPATTEIVRDGLRPRVDGGQLTVLPPRWPEAPLGYGRDDEHVLRGRNVETSGQFLIAA